MDEMPAVKSSSLCQILLSVCLLFSSTGETELALNSAGFTNSNAALRAMFGFSSQLPLCFTSRFLPAAPVFIITVTKYNIKVF